MGYDRLNLAGARILAVPASQFIRTYGLLICLIALSFGICDPSRAGCRGADLFDQLLSEDPEGLATI